MELGNVALLLWECGRGVIMCIESGFCVLVDPELVVYVCIVLFTCYVLCILCKTKLTSDYISCRRPEK